MGKSWSHPWGHQPTLQSKHSLQVLDLHITKRVPEGVHPCWAYAQLRRCFHQQVSSLYHHASSEPRRRALRCLLSWASPPVLCFEKRQPSCQASNSEQAKKWVQWHQDCVPERAQTFLVRSAAQHRGRLPGVQTYRLLATSTGRRIERGSQQSDWVRLRGSESAIDHLEYGWRNRECIHESAWYAIAKPARTQFDILRILRVSRQ